MSVHTATTRAQATNPSALGKLRQLHVERLNKCKLCTTVRKQLCAIRGLERKERDDRDERRDERRDESGAIHHICSNTSALEGSIGVLCSNALIMS